MNHGRFASALLLASSLGLCANCLAAADMESDELVLDVANALQTMAPHSPEDAPLAWIYMEASGSATSLNDSVTQPRFISPRELLNRVSIGAWKWDNGTQLRLSGDRVRLSYGSKFRFNFTVKPFRSTDQLSLTVNTTF